MIRLGHPYDKERIFVFLFFHTKLALENALYQLDRLTAHQRSYYSVLEHMHVTRYQVLDPGYVRPCFGGVVHLWC